MLKKVNSLRFTTTCTGIPAMLTASPIHIVTRCGNFLGCVPFLLSGFFGAFKTGFTHQVTQSFLTSPAHLLRFLIPLTVVGGFLLSTHGHPTLPGGDIYLPDSENVLRLWQYESITTNDSEYITLDPPSTNYVVHPDTNGILHLWEVTGETTVTRTNTITEIKAANEKHVSFLPEIDGEILPFKLTVTSFNFDTAYTRLIIKEADGVYILQPQTSTNLTTWTDTDIFIEVNSNGTSNSVFTLGVEL